MNSILLLATLALSVMNIGDSFARHARQGLYTKKPQQIVYIGKTYKPEKQNHTLIAWDLNNVVFTKKFGAKEFMTVAFKKFGAWNGGLALGNLLSIKKKFNKQRARQKISPLGWEHLMYHLLRSNNDDYHQQAYFLQSCIEGPDRIDMHVAGIIYDCENLGYKQAVLSNMWESNLMVQIDTLKQQIIELPESSFERKQLHIVSGVIPTEENNWVHKTEKEVYQLFLIKNKKHSDTTTIFIDDNPANVKSANNSGFDIGIVFTNAYALRMELERLNILPVAHALVGIPVAA